MLKKIVLGCTLFLSIKAIAQIPIGGVSSVAGTTPIVSSTAGGAVMVSCPTCSTSTGTVSSVSVVSANGVSGTVATSTTTPAITLSLGAITPTSVTSLVTGTTGTTLNGDATSTPSTLMQVTATNTGSTSGIPSGYSCMIQHVFDTGTNYDASAFCKAPSSGRIFGYVSPAHTLGSEVYSAVYSITSGGMIQAVSSVLASSGFINTPVTITASATPAIVASNGLQTITLNANSTPTISGIVSGQRVTFQICQPASGGPYTWAWPTAVHGGVTIGTTASTCSVQSFDSFSGSTLVAESSGIINIAP